MASCRHNMHNPIHALIHLGIWLLPHNQTNNRIIQVYNYALVIMISIKSWLRESLFNPNFNYSKLPRWSPSHITDVTPPIISLARVHMIFPWSLPTSLFSPFLFPEAMTSTCSNFYRTQWINNHISYHLMHVT